MVGRQIHCVAPRLAESPPHQLVVTGAGLPLRLVGNSRKARQLTDLALLSFQDEAAALVEIDEACSACFSSASDRGVDAIIASWSWRLNA